MYSYTRINVISKQNPQKNLVGFGRKLQNGDWLVKTINGTGYYTEKEINNIPCYYHMPTVVILKRNIFNGKD
jgi:hypothetical protein